MVFWVCPAKSIGSWRSVTPSLEQLRTIVFVNGSTAEEL
jgi:hypothetical protein